MITIEIPKTLVVYFSSKYGESIEEAERHLQDFINLCNITEGKTEREDRLEAVIWDSFKVLETYGVNILRYRLDALPKAIREALPGQAEGDRLYKAARAMLDYYEKEGPFLFTARFFTLDVIPVCKKIVEEGEGNPHPWR